MPVLSNSTVRASPSVSIAPAPLTITPARAARERPETSAIGAARISGHGVATTTTASARTGSPLNAQARPATRIVAGRKNAGVAVGHPHERRALRLGLLDQPHERRVRALAGGPVGADVERRAGVCRTAEHRHPARGRLGQRLAAERARVDHRLGADDRSVDRNDLAGPHERRRRRPAPGRPAPPRGDHRPAAARPSGRAGSARSAPVAPAGRRPPQARRRRRTSARSRRRRAPRPSASAPTIATSAIVSTPRLCSTTIVRPTSTASSAASSATAARHTAVASRARPEGVQQAAGHDRDGSDRSENLSAMVNQPEDPGTVTPLLVAGRIARASDRWRRRGGHVGKRGSESSSSTPYNAAALARGTCGPATSRDQP